MSKGPSEIDTTGSEESIAIQEVEFKPGQVLFHENETTYHFFVIQEGSIEVVKLGPGGVEVRIATVSEGTSIGEFAMIDRLPRSATARALTHVRAARISESAYRELLGELPDWAVSVMRALVERLRQTNEIVRKAGLSDPQAEKRMEAVEYETTTDTIVDSNPFLSKD